MSEDTKLPLAGEDPMRGGSFTIEDLRGTGIPGGFLVRVYDRAGNLLRETLHQSNVSPQIECGTLHSRGAVRVEPRNSR